MHKPCWRSFGTNNKVVFTDTARARREFKKNRGVHSLKLRSRAVRSEQILRDRFGKPRGRRLSPLSGRCGTSLGHSIDMRNAQTSIRQNVAAGGIALAAIFALAIPAAAEQGLNVDQSTYNSGNVTTHATNIKVWGGLTGAGASASIGATGAVSSLAATSINSGYAAGSIAGRDIRQLTENVGAVTSLDNSIRAGALSGKGASVIISVTGAVSSVSTSSIGSPISLSLGRNASITQSSKNTGNITNSGAISVRGLSGAGVSVGISTVGATTAVSFSGIR